jgi:hypothetical protein
MGRGAAEICPYCGAPLIDAAEGGWVEGRYECPNCTDGGVFFMKDGGLVDSMHRSGDTDRVCVSCSQSLTGAEYIAKWEDGDNAEAYLICPWCRFRNPF